MRKYSREVVAEVLAANDIVDIVGAALELKPAGSGRLKALCPFHNEKTPSFTVNRHRQIFHCFGCGKGGDAIAFLVEHDGLSFVEALRKLADRAGVRLPALSERDNESEFLRTRLFEFGKFVSRHYREVLQDRMRGGIGRQYLKTRELKEATVQRFGLGYAQDGWTNLLDAARQAGLKDNVLEASGLFKRGERGGLYDFFRKRLMFPIKDLSGNVVAFGGRDLGDSPAKYINSPETAVYKKSRVLYGLDEARDTLRRDRYAILVEGYFDLLRCFDAGIEQVVATCGTALTEQQAALIRRYVPEVVLVYDGDAAGIQAALKATGVLTAAGLTVRATALPDNQDPDDFIRAHGAEAFLERVNKAVDFVSFYAQMSEGRTKTIEGRTEVAQEIFGLLKGIDDEVRVDEYLKRTARELGLNDWACRTEFRKYRKRAPQRRTPARPETPSSRPISRDDCHFVAALLDDAALRAHANTALRNVDLGEGPLAEVLRGLFRSEASAMDMGLETEDARRLYAAAATTALEDIGDAEELVHKQTVRLEKEALRVQAAQVQAELQEAQRLNDPAKLTQLLARKVTLDQEMEQVGVT